MRSFPLSHLPHRVKKFRTAPTGGQISAIGSILAAAWFKTQKRRLPLKADVFPKLNSGNFFHNPVHLIPLFFHIGNQLELGAAAVEIVAGTVSAEINIPLKIVR